MSDPTLKSLQLLIEANDRRLNDLMKERDLRDQQRHDASRDALHAALGCAKEAITKAEAAYEKRFDNTLFSSRCDCIDSYRSRRRANVLVSRARSNWRQ